MLPNFICPGAQKAATTTLHESLKDHPKVFLPQEKETHFFDIDRRYARGREWYEEEYYKEAKEFPVVGDITPRYMYYRWVPERIHDTLGKDVKFVFMLRNPVDRAYSHYWMHRTRSDEELQFEEAIERETQRRRRLECGRIRELERSGDIRGYLARGFYSQQIRGFLEHYPRDRMLFVLFEDFISDMRSELERILDFLGLEFGPEIRLGIEANPAKKPRTKWVNRVLRSSVIRKLGRIVVPRREIRHKVAELFERLNLKQFDKPELSEPLRAELLDFYEPEFEELEGLTGCRVDKWRDHR